MFITKKSLARRTFLRGMGVTLSLPLLDAMVPALSALSRTAANPIRRLGFVYFPNGPAMAKWNPAVEGPLAEMPLILKSLTPLSDYSISRTR